MDVRDKVLAVTIAVFLSLVLVFAMLSISFGLQNYERIEMNMADKGFVRIENALGRELEELDRIVMDWAAWDDTYAFVDDKNQNYIESNLLGETYQNLHVDFIVYVNRDAEVVYWGSDSSDESSRESHPLSLLPHLKREDLLVARPLNGEGVKGVISLEEGPALVSAKPILTSRREGPANGALIMGRFLNDETLAHLSEITEYRVELLNDVRWGKDAAFETGTDGTLRSISVSADGRNLELFTTIRDLYGSPAFTLATVMDREVYAQGVASISRLLLFGFILACLLGVVMLVTLERFVLRRLERLDHAIRTITPDSESRIDLDGNDEFSRLAATIEEMLARLREANDRLSASEKRYQAVVESQAELIARFDPSGNLKFANEAFLRFFGIGDRDFEGRKFIPHVHPEDLPLVTEYFRSFTLDEPLKRIVHRILLTDGSIRWVEWTDLAIFDEKGRIIEFQSVGRDVTEQRDAEERIRTLNKRLNDIVDSLPDATFVMDSEMRIVTWNREMERMFGIRKEMVLQRDLQECRRQLDAVNAGYLLGLLVNGDEQDERFENLKREGEAIYAETKDVLHLGNREVHAWIKISPLYGANGSRSGYIGSIRDITDRKLAEKSIAQANAKLKLLSSLTRHDILNGITALRFYLECAAEGGSREERAHFMERAHQALGMIKTMIEFTRDYQDIGVQAPRWQHVGRVLESVKVQIDAQGIRITWETDGLWLYADSMLEKVFYNLIENSIRHGEHVTQISFTFERGEEGVDLIYSDDGIGIPESDKEKIFRQGYGKNTGFGLFLSRQILSLTGLTITENGIYGKGARFVIHASRGMFRMESDSGQERTDAGVSA